MARALSPTLTLSSFSTDYNFSLFPSSNPPSFSSSYNNNNVTFTYTCSNYKQLLFVLPMHKTSRRSITLCKAAEYKFPDPIPEFADSETEKFKSNLEKKLSKKGVCGDSLDEVVSICTEIFSTFLHAEYGGPGTLLVIPFIDMADTLEDRGLPGGPQAARAAVKWAQDNVDKDWKEWTS